MDNISFSKNWNNKFCCEVFTTIRPSKPSRKPGDIVGVKLTLQNGTVLREKAKIRHKQTMMLKDIPECIYAVDCGMPKNEAMALISDLYTPYGVDVFKIQFDIIILTHYYD